MILPAPAAIIAPEDRASAAFFHFAPTTEMGAMRTAQQELIDQLDYVYMGAPTADEAYDHHDHIHFSVEGYGDIAEVLAQSVVDVIGVDQVVIA